MLKEETKQRTHKALIIFIALSRVQNESYTHFLGMFKHEQKQIFNHLINASNTFIKTVEKTLPQQSINATNELEEYFQGFTATLIDDKEFFTDKHSQVKKYLNELNTDNSFVINEVLKLIDLKISNLQNNV